MNFNAEAVESPLSAIFPLLKIVPCNIDSGRAGLRKIAGAGAALEYALHGDMRVLC